MDKTIKMTVSIDYIMLDRNFGKNFGKVGARPKHEFFNSCFFMFLFNVLWPGFPTKPVIRNF